MSNRSRASRIASSACAGSWSSRVASCRGTAMPSGRPSSTSSKARSKNMPATAPCRSCTRPATSLPRPRASPIGGRTPATRRWCCSPPTCSRIRPTPTCNPLPLGCDAPPPGHHILSFRLEEPVMNEISAAAAQSETHAHSEGVLLRSIVIGLPAFLTVVDLFATRAILPSLTRHYGVTPADMGFAVNASTLGMAFSGLAIGYFSREIDRRKGILASLALLAIPTPLLAHAPDLTTFTLLRVAQGLCMAAAFTLTLAYLGEHYSAADSASAFAAYITGNVASNLIGRLISAAVADHFGLASNFYFFAVLNLLGAVLVYFTVEKTPCMTCVTPAVGSHFNAWIMHLKNASLRASFAIGFCILFAFIGTFTFVNFFLVQPPPAVSAMTLGFG